MPARQRLAFAAIAALIAVVAVIVLAGSGGSDDPGSAATDQDGGATPAATATAQPEQTPPAAGETPQADEDAAEPEATTEPTPEPKPEVPEIVIRDGEPSGGVRELSFEEGERVRFAVTSDVTDHVHVHGFDIMRDVAPGKTVRFNFPASITGIFEVELEDRGVEIASLRVEP